MKLLRVSAASFATTSLLALAVGCGSSAQNDVTSNVQFVKSSEKKAFLEDRDLKDAFVFGFRVTNTKNFFTGAMSLDFRPSAVKLELDTDPKTRQPKLYVVAANGRSAFMGFDAVRGRNGKVEVDFGSAGNDLELYSGINQLGASILSMAPSASDTPWKTEGKPRVLSIQQDADTIVADVEHNVSYARKGEDGKVEKRTGSVTLRIYLQRQSTARLAGGQTVGEARKLNIGFFPSNQTVRDTPSAPIARYAIDTRSRGAAKIVYLKDFPSDMVQVGREAVTVWNAAFGFEAFRVEIAPAGVDIGDPRFNVIKWNNGLEKDVPWAGYAPTMTDPTSGAVLATQILINGDNLRRDEGALADYTNTVSGGFNGLRGKIGNVPVVEGQGENPVMTFFTDTTQKNSATYVNDYYRSVIMHEFGHSLGLRHNFAASTKVEAGGIASSVMDYEPNFNTNKRKAIGSYDLAAIRYGYFGEAPRAALAFCTDEDIAKRIDCNQGDIGNPVDFVTAALVNGAGFLSNSTVALPTHVEKPMQGAIKNAFKLLDLVSQVAADKRDEAKANLQRALDAVRGAAPASDLSSADAAIAASNITKLKKSYAAVVKDRSSGDAVLVSE